uniref:CSTF_C domain-containing protein n=1 Tax=Steinernema glaseri TaxID=37863 RepID=A0A1I8A072_9BILA
MDPDENRPRNPFLKGPDAGSSNSRKRPLPEEPAAPTPDTMPQQAAMSQMPADPPPRRRRLSAMEEDEDEPMQLAANELPYIQLGHWRIPRIPQVMRPNATMPRGARLNAMELQQQLNEMTARGGRRTLNQMNPEELRNLERRLPADFVRANRIAISMIMSRVLN